MRRSAFVFKLELFYFMCEHYLFKRLISNLSDGKRFHDIGLITEKVIGFFTICLIK